MNIKRNIKRVMIVGTMIVAISFGGNTWGSSTVSASPVAKLSLSAASLERDDLLEALKQPSGEDLYYSLYEGKSLAEIASENSAEVQQVIDLQTEQLTRQLDQRLASGSITPEQYEAYKAEVPDIIRSSVYRL
ncbi:hypothetical protein SAMN04487895_107147 [Paenibacillus sophorae]|uniref:Short C-terminal domain-containing protein n=1 Tax=Paenibacillus sophorae TaxID=1333845 RepID=A0A1H8PDD1_9BACL|nr:hypothetical protein [Paenibacillus sophorae]QWU16528.1 hypothetical protein KP014_04645 [Paenibacillus sophorae]SEO39694.1 hypothetical protein SAMN04487895_107147 [Paenibacillus sophorae]